METDARLVVLYGENGRGKTNLLEAAGVLATLRSFREPRLARCVRAGQQEASIAGRVASGMGTRTLAWRWTAGRRTLEVDGVETNDLGRWFEVLRAVVFTPEQVMMIRGEPELRRRFIDRAAFTARPDYLDLVRDWRRVVVQKTALLRSGAARPAELEPWDAQIVALGARIRLRRLALVRELQAPMQEVVEGLAPGEQVRLALRGDGVEAGEDEEAQARALWASLARLRPEEARQRQVLAGVGRDDLEILLEGRPARRHASQGQARTLALALRLAEVEAARIRGQSPLLLLDDLGGELDQGRRERLVARLGALDNQVWITTTDPLLLGRSGAEACAWRVTADAVVRG